MFCCGANLRSELKSIFENPSVSKAAYHRKTQILGLTNQRPGMKTRLGSTQTKKIGHYIRFAGNVLLWGKSVIRIEIHFLKSKCFQGRFSSQDADMRSGKRNLSQFKGEGDMNVLGWNRVSEVAPIEAAAERAKEAERAQAR